MVLAHARASGWRMNCSAATSLSVVRSSMAMGAGPTPRRLHAPPQKLWSPKKGTTVVGQPAIKPVQQLPVLNPNTSLHVSAGRAHAARPRKAPDDAFQCTEACRLASCPWLAREHICWLAAEEHIAHAWKRDWAGTAAVHAGGWQRERPASRLNNPNGA